MRGSTTYADSRSISVQFADMLQLGHNVASYPVQNSGGPAEMCMTQSYSWEGEDICARKLMIDIFGVTKGFYVDVGAHHPFNLSNTALLYSEGWRGINIDATPGSMEILRTYRPDDINLEIAVASEPGVQMFSCFTNTALKNSAGAFVKPSQSSIAAAGAQASGLSATNFNIVNGPGAATYPLANFSWTLIYQKQSNTNQGIVLGKLLDRVTTTGQQQASALGYSPLPANVVSLAHQTLLTLENSAGKPLF